MISDDTVGNKWTVSLAGGHRLVPRFIVSSVFLSQTPVEGAPAGAFNAINQTGRSQGITLGALDDTSLSPGTDHILTTGIKQSSDSSEIVPLYYLKVP